MNTRTGSSASVIDCFHFSAGKKKAVLSSFLFPNTAGNLCASVLKCMFFNIAGMMQHTERQEQPQEILVFHVPHNSDMHMNYAFLVFHYLPAGKSYEINPHKICSPSDHRVVVKGPLSSRSMQYMIPQWNKKRDKGT